MLTAAAFYYFALNKTNFVILEVGLGGLFDATNVIDNPACTVITTIDFDHTSRLGNTIDEIAAQKAGIIKKNSPVVVLENNLGFKIIQKEALKNDAKLMPTPKVDILFEDFSNNYALVDNKKYKFNLLGSHQKDNLALALGAIKALNLNIKEETIKSALNKVNWKFRLDYKKNKNILIDGAHNPNGIESLKSFMDEYLANYKKTIIFG